MASIVFLQLLRFILTKKDQGQGLSLEFEISRQGEGLLRKERNRERRKIHERKYTYWKKSSISLRMKWKRRNRKVRVFLEIGCKVSFIYSFGMVP